MISSHSDLDAVCGTFLGISSIVVVLRYYYRVTRDSRFLADDWLMIPSYLLFVGWTASILYGTHHRVLGYTTPETKANGPYPQTGVGVNRAVETLAAAFFGCVKASALLFFQRVFCVPGRIDAFRIAIWTLLILTALWSVAFILVPILQCGTHISAAWSSTSIKAKYCGLANPYLESQSITDTVFDFIILALPIPKIWSFKTCVRRRLAVLLVFSTGTVSLAAAIAKTVIVFSAAQHQAGTDPLIRSSQVFFIWVLEGGFAVVAVNLPTLVWLKSSQAPERMLASVRSFLSIASARKSEAGDPIAPMSDSKGLGQSALTDDSNGMGLVPKNCVHHESHAVSNMTSRSTSVPGGQLHVTNVLTQTFETA